MQDLIAGMVAAMRAAPGIGLAAPQVGVSWRMFVMEDRPEMTADLPKDVLLEREREPAPLRVLINPVVRRSDRGRATSSRAASASRALRRS
jgi:peptide deformylase